VPEGGVVALRILFVKSGVTDRWQTCQSVMIKLLGKLGKNRLRESVVNDSTSKQIMCLSC